MKRTCSIGQHINGEYIRKVYPVSNCCECGWRREPQKVTLGMFSITYPDKCLKTPLKKHGIRIIRNINILPSWCPLPESEARVV